MAISLTITVVDIAGTLVAGYTHIKVYRSAEENTGFSEITTTASLIALEAGENVYAFVDETATTKHWYQTSFFDTNEVVTESAFSASFVGTFTDTRFSPISYPTETEFTSDDYFVTDRVRILLGDLKELTRDYVSVAAGYSSISEDQFTHTLSNPRGWPLRVTLDGVAFITKDEPRVNDHQFITFSGSQINTTSGTLDVWYDHFRHSDAEILQVYNALTPPPQLDADQVTFELAAVCTALDMLEQEFRVFGATSGSMVDIFEEIKIDPRGGMTARLGDLEALRQRKHDLIDEILKAEMGADIYGVILE